MKTVQERNNFSCTFLRSGEDFCAHFRKKLDISPVFRYNIKDTNSIARRI